MEHLGKYCTVFQAETIAIIRAGQQLIKRKGQSIVIKIDSQAAIRALNSNWVTSSQVKECTNVLNKLGKFNKVTLKQEMRKQTNLQRKEQC